MPKNPFLRLILAVLLGLALACSLTQPGLPSPGLQTPEQPTEPPPNQASEPPGDRPNAPPSEPPGETPEELSGEPFLTPLPSAPAATNAAPFALAFPRLGMWWPNPWEQPLDDIARYDWVIFYESAQPRVRLIKELNPRLIALTATNASEVSFNPSSNASPNENAEVRSIPAEWFLTQVGSTLTAAVDAAQTTFQVAAVTASDGTDSIDLFRAGEAALIGSESVYIESVDRTARTLRVRRGYVRPATAHPAGTRIAAHITFWPNSWVLNLSTLAPTALADPRTGPERWYNYHARQDAKLLTDPIWDGMLIDRGDTNESWLIGNSTARSIDPNNSNRLLSDYSAFNAAWNAGLRQYVTLLRQQMGDGKLLFANWGMANYDLLNGNNFEGFPMDDGTSFGLPWSATVFGPKSDGAYFDWMRSARQPNLTMIETYEEDGGPDPGGSGDYDNPCDDRGFTPNYRKMRFGLTTALLNDGFFSYEMNTDGHGSLCLLWFDEYDNAGNGRGYLGQPYGPAYRAMGALKTANQASNGGLDTQAQLNGWNLSAEDGYTASVALDTAQKAMGAGSARIQVAQAGGEAWRVGLGTRPLRLTAGTEYTISFWAKADQARKIAVWAQRESAPWTRWLDYPDFPLTTEWQRFEIAVTAAGSDSSASLNFGFGATTGTVWIDGVMLQQGNADVWRRDFGGGIALVNATNSPQTVDLGGEFQKIQGRQDRSVNDGSLVTQVTLPPRDGIILLRTIPGDVRVYVPTIIK